MAEQQAFREVREALEEWQAAKNRNRRRHNDDISRISPGGHAKVGDYVLVKDASTSREGFHSKLAHELLDWTMASSPYDTPRTQLRRIPERSQYKEVNSVCGGHQTVLQTVPPASGRTSSCVRGRVPTLRLGPGYWTC